MKRYRPLLVLLASLAVFTACLTENTFTDGGGNDKKGPKKKDPVLLTFTDNGTKKFVTKSEFEYVYQKNNGGWEAAKQHDQGKYQEYLNLYINFKRKVFEAEHAGLDTTKSFKTEFEGYRKQLSQPYLVEKDVLENLIKEAYDRGKWVVSASHILVMVKKDALPADTLIAYNKIMALRDSITKNGKSFGDIATRHTEDPYGKKDKGYLGYFSSFDMVYPFENACYNATPGQVTMPVRTEFGYHLIMVHEKIENKGIQYTSHIIIRVGPQYSAKDSIQAEAKIKEIWQKLKGGEDFCTLAASYSDDPITSKKCGDLGSGRLLPALENAKRKLNAGEFSEPVKTMYGWHIVKVNKIDPLKTFDESRNEIKSKINKDARSFISRDRLIQRVKTENAFSLNQSVVTELTQSITNAQDFMKGTWKPVDSLHKDLLSKQLYTIGMATKKTVALSAFTSWYTTAKRSFASGTLDAAVQTAISQFIDQEMLTYEEAMLPTKYPEFSQLLKEYRDGILLFTLTENKVWKKAVEDTTGLKKFFEDHRENFKAGDRISVREYYSENRQVLENVIQYLNSGRTDKYIDSISNASSPLNLKSRTLLFEKGKPEVQDSWFSMEVGKRTEIIPSGKGFRILVILDKIPAGLKTFSEAKSECITQYQNSLEQSWLKELETKYPVVVNKKVMSSLFK